MTKKRKEKPTHNRREGKKENPITKKRRTKGNGIGQVSMQAGSRLFTQ